jgi:hypothetical protein
VKYYAQPAATHPIKEKNQTPAVWPKRDRRLLQRGSQVASSLPRTLNTERVRMRTKHKKTSKKKTAKIALIHRQPKISLKNGPKQRLIANVLA